jgi:hypothetical protein
MQLITVHPDYEEIIRSEKEKRSHSLQDEIDSVHGVLTRAAAAYIAGKLRGTVFDIYSDHGSKGADRGKIVSSINEEYKRGDELAQLDIAVVNRVTNQIIALVEIEESTVKPKTILGDVFGTLTGNFISLPGKPKSTVGNYTTLIVICKGRNHEIRNDHIREKALIVKPALRTRNSEIGEIVIKTFTGSKKLYPVLLDEIKRAINRTL